LAAKLSNAILGKLFTRMRLCHQTV